MIENNGIVDQRVSGYSPLISPYQLKQDIPRSYQAVETVTRGRQSIENILDGTDPRIFIIGGPCSIHDPEAAREFANETKELSDKVSDQFLIVMRMYFEKPRTGLGWEGLITDPNLDGSNDMNKGLHLSRKVLLDIAELGLPVATEYLDPFVPQFNSDFISWAAIGARTAYSPQHRKMASGLSMPAGIKNDTHGDISIAVNGVLSARGRHSFLGINEYGAPSVVNTLGNPYGHIVLRGGDEGPNYDEENVRSVQAMLEKEGLPPNVVIDCSHDNSNKDYKKQSEVFESVIKQIVDGNKGIVGLMVECNLKEGNQKIPLDLTGFDPTTLEYGQSVTDGCIGLETAKLMIMDSHKSLSRTIFPVGK